MRIEFVMGDTSLDIKKAGRIYYRPDEVSRIEKLKKAFSKIGYEYSEGKDHIDIPVKNYTEYTYLKILYVSAMKELYRQRWSKT